MNQTQQIQAMSDIDPRVARQTGGTRLSTHTQMSQTQKIQAMKDIDQQVALQIGGLAGLPTRDKRGNVMVNLWVKYSEQSMVGMLLETSDIRKILLEQIQLQLVARKDLIQEMEQTDIVVKWLMSFTSAWETEYSNNIVSQYDIGQLVLSCMTETYFEIAELLNHSRHFQKSSASKQILKAVSSTVEIFKCEQQHTQKDVEDALAKIAIAESAMATRMNLLDRSATEQQRHIVKSMEMDVFTELVRVPRKVVEDGNVILNMKLHEGDDAAIRLLFRHPVTRTLMCRVAGAILRKQEVCNRSGGYSAKVQRNDITQQKNIALDTFCAWVLDNDERLRTIADLLHNDDQMRYWITDHKVSHGASNGMHYKHGLYDL